MAAKKGPSRFTLHVIVLSGDKNAALICHATNTIPRRYRPSEYPDSPKQQIPQKSDLIDAPCLADTIFLATPIE